MLVSLILFAFGTVVVAKVAQYATRRLGLEPYAVLEWLGLADDPDDELSARRRAAPYRKFGTRSAGAGSA